MILSSSRVTAVDRHGNDHPSLLSHLELPSGTAVVELHTDGTPDLERYEALHPRERHLVARAVASRRSDFGDARWCAHEALRRWGTEACDIPILRGDSGMPLFPDGVVGTLSHTEGIRGALVGDAVTWRSVGLDVEQAVPLPAGVFNAVTSPSERWALSRLVGDTGRERLLGTVLFSAKETVYKSWFPLAGRFLDFDEAEVALDMSRGDVGSAGSAGGSGQGYVGGSWRARLLTSPTPVDEIHGSWVVRGGYVATVCGVRA